VAQRDIPPPSRSIEEVPRPLDRERALIAEVAGYSRSRVSQIVAEG
jgi:hypothetical protein